jgi:hypothetical protein
MFFRGVGLVNHQPVMTFANGFFNQQDPTQHFFGAKL